jgi:hypothetical protein
MKRKSIYTFIACLFAGIIVFMACTKEEENVRLNPKLSTSLVKDLTSDSAIVVGFVIAEGDGFTEKGVCYGTSALPTISNNKVIFNKEAVGATYDVKLTGLTRLTTYHARSYATNAGGTIYGDEIEFSTPAALPTIANIVAPTLAVTADKGVTATTAINITDDGGPHATADITERGVFFGFSPNPAIDSVKSKLEANRTFKTTEGTGKGEFTSLATNLKGNKTYYFKAYATNKIGTRFSNEVTFTTPIALPILKTSAITELKVSSAKSGGEITDNGGGTITERGICWGTTENPTVDDNVIVSEQGDDSFSAEITGLAMSSTYHVRAYAKNSAGIGYGPNVKFLTFPPALYMIGSGVGDWDWANTDLPMIPVHSQPNLFWKIVWMKGSGEFKFSPTKAWTGDFGKTGDAVDGVYTKGGDNIPVPSTAGYYMVLVDFTTNKIAITTPKVYLTGNTVGSWGNADAANIFTVDNANEVLTITKTLAADNLRMFVYHPWITDWWHAELNIFSNKIEFRGTGGDQAAVPVTAGSKTINLNFKTGAGSIL